MLNFFLNKTITSYKFNRLLKVLLKLVTNYEDGVFMVHFTLAFVRHNVLMRHKRIVGS